MAETQKTSQPESVSTSERSRDIHERMQAYGEPAKIVSEIRTVISENLNRLDTGGKARILVNFPRNVRMTNTGSAEEKISLATNGMDPMREMELLSRIIKTIQTISDEAANRVHGQVDSVLTAYEQESVQKKTENVTQETSSAETPQVTKAVTTDAQPIELSTKKNEPPTKKKEEEGKKKEEKSAFWTTISNGADYFNIFSEKFWMKTKK